MLNNVRHNDDCKIWFFFVRFVRNRNHNSIVCKYVEGFIIEHPFYNQNADE